MLNQIERREIVAAGSDKPRAGIANRLLIYFISILSPTILDIWSWLIPAARPQTRRSDVMVYGKTESGTMIIW